jgi:hypothetical protein
LFGFPSLHLYLSIKRAKPEINDASPFCKRGKYLNHYSIKNYPHFPASVIPEKTAKEKNLPGFSPFSKGIARKENPILARHSP